MVSDFIWRTSELLSSWRSGIGVTPEKSTTSDCWKGPFPQLCGSKVFHAQRTFLVIPSVTATSVALSQLRCHWFLILGLIMGLPTKYRAASLMMNLWVAAESPEDELRLYDEVMLRRGVADGCQPCESFHDSFPWDPELGFHSRCHPWECRVLVKSVERM